MTQFNKNQIQTVTDLVMEQISSSSEPARYVREQLGVTEEQLKEIQSDEEHKDYDRTYELESEWIGLFMIQVTKNLTGKLD